MQLAVAIGLDALNFMLALLLVALGLLVIFGIMGVINMAHGEFFLLGAYCVVFVQGLGLSFWWTLLLAPLVLAVLGLALEELVIRHIYHRFLDSILATWGLSLALKQFVIIIYGPTSQSIVSPIPGLVEVLGTSYPAYRLFIMAVSVAVAGAVFLVFYRTHIGLAARGVIANRWMAGALGIDTRRVNRLTFAAGAALAGFAGAVMAPIMSVDPQMGVGFLVPAFLSILVGGTGTLLGAIIGTGTIAGTTTIVSTVWTPVAAQILVFTLAIVLIRLFPRGIVGMRGP